MDIECGGFTFVSNFDSGNLAHVELVSKKQNGKALYLKRLMCRIRFNFVSSVWYFCKNFLLVIHKLGLVVFCKMRQGCWMYFRYTLCMVAHAFYNNFRTTHLYITNVYWVWGPVIGLYACVITPSRFCMIFTKTSKNTSAVFNPSPYGFKCSLVKMLILWMCVCLVWSYSQVEVSVGQFPVYSCDPRSHPLYCKY